MSPICVYRPHYCLVIFRQIGERSFYGIAKEKLEALVEFRNRSASGENVGLVQQM